MPANIRATEQKISRYFGSVSKLKYFLPTSALLKPYYAFVHPHLFNEFIIWKSTHSTYLKNLSTSNQAVRLLGGGPIESTLVVEKG